MLSAKCRPFCVGLNVLWQILQHLPEVVEVVVLAVVVLAVVVPMAVAAVAVKLAPTSKINIWLKWCWLHWNANLIAFRFYDICNSKNFWCNCINWHQFYFSVVILFALYTFIYIYIHYMHISNDHSMKISRKKGRQTNRDTGEARKGTEPI